MELQNYLTELEFMAVKATTQNDDSELAWLMQELQIKDAQVAKNWVAITDLAKVGIENNKILAALAERREEMREELNNLSTEFSLRKKS